MSRTQLVWIILGLITLLSGCRLGMHPFDYCGPVVEGGRSACGPRAGSILSGRAPVGPPPVEEGAAIEDAMIAPDGPETPEVGGVDVLGPSAVEGETRVLRVTEGPALTTDGDLPSADGPQMPGGMEITAPQNASDKGWAPVRRAESQPQLQPTPVDDGQ